MTAHDGAYVASRAGIGKNGRRRTRRRARSLRGELTDQGKTDRRNREARLCDEWRQRGGVAKADTKQDYAKQQQGDVGTGGERKNDAAGNLSGVASTGDRSAIGAERHQPAEKRAADDCHDSHQPHRESRPLGAERRHQQGEQVGNQPDLGEQPQRHACRERDESAVAPEQ